MQCTDVPVCKTYATDAGQAIKALGWTEQVITFASAQGNTELQQAVALHPFAIMMSGGDPAALLKTGLAAAHKAGIPVTTYGATDPSNPASGFTAVPYNTAVPYTNAILDWDARQANGKANILFVNVPAIPVFAAAGDAAKAELAKDCPGCTFTALNATLQQLTAGNIPQLVVSELQAHPGVQYVDLEWSDLLPGLIPAMKAAGFSKVAVTGGSVNEVSLQAVANGQAKGWSVVPIDSDAWLAVDAIARVSVGMTLTPSYLKSIEYGALPAWVISTQAEAQTLLKNNPVDPWPGPTGWQQQFKHLWHLTS